MCDKDNTIMDSLSLADPHQTPSFNAITLSQSGLSDSGVYEKAKAIVEYEWPVDSGAVFFIEEYLTDFLEIKSMRRSYPTIERRKIQTLEEREFLLGKCIVNELQCDLGVYAIPEKQVYESLAPNYKEKFEIYKQTKLKGLYEDVVETVWKATVDNYDDIQGSAITVEHLRVNAAKACATWNAKNNKDTYKFRPAFMDQHTGIYHQRQCGKNNATRTTTPGYFPVAVLPGQYVDHAPRFSIESLKHLPLNTVLVDTFLDSELSTGFASSTVESLSKMNEDEDETLLCEERYFVSRRSSSSSTITCSMSGLDSDFMENKCDTLLDEIMAVKNKLRQHILM